MKKRLITGIFIGLIFTPLLVLGGYFALAGALFLSYVAGFELLNLFSKQNILFKSMRFVYPIYSLVIVGSVFAVTKGWFNPSDVIFVLLVETLISAFLCLLNKKMKMSDLGYLMITLLYSGVMFSSFIYIRELTSIGKITHEYLGLIILGYLIICSFGTDIGAYIFGTLFGKHPFFKEISPKKSMEGSVLGSLFGTVLSSAFLIIMFNIIGYGISFSQGLVICIISYIICILSEFGDLIASKFKRDFQIKDYGNIFPGHGGVLDRFDSLVFSSSCFIILLMMILG